MALITSHGNHCRAELLVLGFFSPANFSVFAYVSHIYDSRRAEPQASHPFLPALLQAFCDVETEYLFSFPCKHCFLTCRGIGLSEWNLVTAPGDSLLQGRKRMTVPSPLSRADGLDKLSNPRFQVMRDSVHSQQLTGALLLVCISEAASSRQCVLFCLFPRALCFWKLGFFPIIRLSSGILLLI